MSITFLPFPIFSTALTMRLDGTKWVPLISIIDIFHLSNDNYNDLYRFTKKKLTKHFIIE